MDINQLLKGINCSCGKRHGCDIKYVYIEKNAARYLTDICKDFQSALIVADQNTYAAAGEITEKVLSEKITKRVIFDGTKILVPDEAAIATVEQSLLGVDIIVGIGSGVIQDLCKYVSHQNKIPYLVVATAPSMDGYASNGAAMITGGMKVTYPAGLPLAIIGDVDVLKNAPIEMIKAGYGDIIGKFSALNDWKLSHLINNEFFCQYIYDLTFEQIDSTLKLANGILKRNEESIKALMEALVIIGILMSFAGSSRPASGSEHHLSHYFEITGILDGSEYFPHGIDVAYSTVITAMLREEILNRPFKKNLNRLSAEELHKCLSKVYGPIANSCIDLQNKVGNYKDRSSVYLEKEKGIRAILEEMPSSEDIYDMLDLVGLDITEFYTLYGKEKIKNAVLFAKELKDRFTVLWLYYDFFSKNE